MFKIYMLFLLAVSMLMSGCSHQQHNMQAQLDTIRLIVKQSAVLAAGVACVAPGSRQDMIHASVTMLRRGMGGPEMAKIHKMMGKMMSQGKGKKADMKSTDSAQMKMHMALHDAGEDVFDFLDVLGSAHAPTCKDVQPVQLAAVAALMREYPGPNMERTQKQLDKHGKQFLRSGMTDSVWQLTQALNKI